jgi:hypothetical protein
VKAVTRIRYMGVDPVAVLAGLEEVAPMVKMTSRKRVPVVSGTDVLWRQAIMCV